MISERISDVIVPQMKFEHGNPHSNALLTFSLQKDSENELSCAYKSSGCQLHKTACQLHISIHLSTNEQRRYVMTSGLRPYIAGFTIANLWRYPIRRRVAFASALD